MRKMMCLLALLVSLLSGCQAKVTATETLTASALPSTEILPAPMETSLAPMATAEERWTEFAVGDYVVCLELDDGESLCNGTIYRADDLTAPIQTFTSDTPPPFLEPYAEDVNFDGQEDFYYLQNQGLANRYYTFWIWDGELERFVEQPDMEKLSLPSFDSKSKTVGTSARASAAHFYDAIYGYVDGDLTLLRSLNMGGDWETQEITVTNYMENHPGLLYSATMPIDENWDDPAYDEFMKFYDLDYWGESDKDYHPPEKKLIEQGEYAVGDYTVHLSLFPRENPRIEEGALHLEGAVWRTDAPDTVLQTFSEEMNRGTYLELHTEDVNFDGLPDFYYKKQNSYNEEFSFWLFGPNKELFYRERRLSGCSSPAFDAENRVVSTSYIGHFGAYAQQFLRWEDGELKRQRVMRMEEGNEDGWQDMYVLDYSGGSETEVFRAEGRLADPEEGVYQDRMGNNVSDEFYRYEDLTYHGK